MNIFEYLGLVPDHRTDSKVTQFVKHYDEVSDIHKDKKFVGQVKKDGVCSLTVIQGEVAAIFSRTGKRFTNTGKLEHDIECMGLSNGIYLGEMCCNLVSLEQLSGVTNPNRVNPVKPDMAHVPNNLEMHWFDLVSINSFIEGFSPASFETRHNVLRNRFTSAPGYFKGPPTSLSVISYTPLHSELAISKFADAAIKIGEEGIVIRDPEATWEAGHKGWRVMKKVRGVDYDLMCIGYEEGKGKYAGKVANLIFGWKDGLEIKCMLGKGWTHKDAENMFHDIQVQAKTFGPQNSPIGQIFQVYALEESSKGKLRLPKVGELRHDKSKPDV